MLSGARTERSWPDASVHHVFLTGSIATVGPAGALISAVCSQFSESHG